MEKKRIFIDPVELKRVMCDNKTYKYIDEKFIYCPPIEIQPIEGFEAPENFPECCDTHRNANKAIREYFTRFPNCCEKHIRLSKRSDFDIKHYANYPELLLNAAIYTDYHIAQRIDNEDWFEDITNYIEYCWDCLGHPPTLTSYYFALIKNYINNPPEELSLPDDKREKLNNYLDKLLDPNVKNIEPTDWNILHANYQKWLKSFPFELSYFTGQKEIFANKLPILSGKSVLNPYTGLTKTNVITEKDLVAFLLDLTKSILQRVNTAELYQSGKIDDLQKSRFEIANEKFRVQHEESYSKYNRGELRYIKAIKSWLTNSQEYFREIADIALAPPPKPKPTKAEKIQEGLYKYGFQELQKVKDLSSNQRQNLINKLAEEKLPYQIAMLDYLGYLNHLKEKYFPTNVRLFSCLSKILSKPDRTISGNYYVLGAVTSENKGRYTANKHKETVEKDYKSIK